MIFDKKLLSKGLINSEFKNYGLKFPTKKIKFMGKKFEICGNEIEIAILLTGLMVCGKEYYELIKSLDIKFGNKKLQKFVEKKFGK